MKYFNIDETDLIDYKKNIRECYLNHEADEFGLIINSIVKKSNVPDKVKKGINTHISRYQQSCKKDLKKRNDILNQQNTRMIDYVNNKLEYDKLNKTYNKLDKYGKKQYADELIYLDQINDLGFNVALIQNNKDSKNYYDTIDVPEIDDDSLHKITGIRKIFRIKR